jgi:hypothetical protein
VLAFSPEGNPYDQIARATTVLCLFFGLMVFAATTLAQTRPPIVEVLNQFGRYLGLDAIIIERYASAK